MAGEVDEVKKGNPGALAPIGVFLVLYLGLGIGLEYVAGVEMGFYQIPIVVVFLVALAVAFLQNRRLSFDNKMDVVARGVGDKTLMMMVLIFLVAGIFVGTVGRSSAESVAYLMLSVVPPQLSVVVLFVVSCFVSISMGTSVGTITLITPIAVTVAAASGFSVPLCIASVMGGAMFGDNLSFISDTTIAACQGQGCDMSDKFKENLKIATPAALVALAIILALSFAGGLGEPVQHDYDLVQVIPYILVLVGGILGLNVFAVLLAGIATGVVVMLASGASTPIDLLSGMGTGVSGMFETAMVAILVSALCALVREHGGFDAVLYAIYSVFKGRRAGQLGMGILVLLMDVATANNTVAIVMANPIAAEMAQTYGVSKRKTASILDTFSCVSQGILPYGAQMLVALSAAATMGVAVSAFEIIPLMFYPMLLLVSSLAFIFLVPERKRKVGSQA